MQRRNGFTLIEMMVAVVLVGLISLIAFPKVNSAIAKNNLRSARVTMANMFAMARATAVGTNKRTWLNFTGNNVYVTASPRVVNVPGSTMDTVGTIQRLDVVYGVTLTPEVASVAYDPRGFATIVGTPKFLVTKSGKRDSVRVDGLGRVIK